MRAARPEEYRRTGWGKRLYSGAAAWHGEGWRTAAAVLGTNGARLMRTIEPSTIMDIVEKFYAVPAHESTWEEALAAYGAEFPNVRFALAGYEGRFENAETVAYANFDDAYIEKYVAHYYKLNPWSGLLQNAPMAPSVVWGHEWVPLDRLKRTEFYADWVKPQGDIVTGFASTLFRDSDRFLLLAANVSVEKLDEGELAADSFRILGPHLRRAFELWRRLENQNFVQNGIELALNKLSSAVFIVDENGKIIFENNRASHLCRTGNLVRVLPNGSIAFRPDENERNVTKYFGEIKRPGHRTPPLMIRLYAASGAPIALFISPIVQEPGDVRSKHSLPSHYVFFLIDLSAEPKTSAESLSTFLRISNAEALLAIALLQDKTIADHANERGISPLTARAQLKSLMQKTETRRQSELVNLLARMFGTFDV